MSKRNAAQIPGSMSAARTLGEYIHEHGPLAFGDIRKALPGAQNHNVNAMLQTWIERDWFYADCNHFITLTQRARRYLDGCEPVVFQGEVAPSRSINLMTRPPYSPPKVYRREPLRQISFVTFSVHEVAG